MKSLFTAMLKFCRQSVDVLIILILILAILGLIWQYRATLADDDWEQFVVKHHCTGANKFKDDKSLKSGWVCNDGKTYYRWRQQV